MDVVEATYKLGLPIDFGGTNIGRTHDWVGVMRIDRSNNTGLDYLFGDKMLTSAWVLLPLLLAAATCHADRSHVPLLATGQRPHSTRSRSSRSTSTIGCLCGVGPNRFV